MAEEKIQNDSSADEIKKSTPTKKIDPKRKKKKDSFLTTIFTDPLYRWFGFAGVLLLLAILAFAGYKGYGFLMHRLAAEQTGEVSQGVEIDWSNFSIQSMRDWIIAWSKAFFSPDNLLTLDFFNNALSVIIILWMVLLAFKDQKSFRNNEHVDYKDIIISIGVLGTFVGIFLGLYNFDVEDIDASVPALLGGLKTAFITSIAGMIFSIVLTAKQAASSMELSSEISLLRSIARSSEETAGVLENNDNFNNLNKNIEELNANLAKMFEMSKNSNTAIASIAQNVGQQLMELKTLGQSFKSSGVSSASNVASNNESAPKDNLF